MDWFIAALIALPCISLGWLALKQAQAKGVSHEHSLAQYFFFIVLFLLVWHIGKGIPLGLPGSTTIILLLVAALISVFGNLLIMYSFEHSSNPGLSLALFATQIFWITIGGVFFFQSSVTFGAGAGVVLVLCGIMLMHVKKGSASFKWAWLALAAAVLGGANWLLIKAIQIAAPEMSASAIIFFHTIPQIPVYLFLGRCKNHKKDFALPVLGFMAFGGLIGTFANTLLVIAITTAPNPGYAHAITSSHVLITLIVSKFLFGSHLSWRHVLATAAIVLGIVIIRIWS